MKKGTRKISKEKIKEFVDEKLIVNPEHLRQKFKVNWKTALNYLKILEADGDVTCKIIKGNKNTRTIWRSKRLDALKDGNEECKA